MHEKLQFVYLIFFHVFIGLLFRLYQTNLLAAPLLLSVWLYVLCVPAALISAVVVCVEGDL